uniref:Uncharacterized protein LOC104229084 n=1 Tax=Nicotiana sylvestris TaxID=4096 RepID=A0A1U7WZ87_NICSY|nr:PREDICTED: uncharacterized protein LOC104229084 [Nicotiana sylvestris]
MRLPFVIVIILLHSHLLQAQLSSRFLLPSEEKLSIRVDEVVTVNKRGGGAAGGHGGGHSGGSGGRASRGGGSRKSPYTATAGVIPVYAAGAMNHHNINRSHNHNAGTTLNCICFSSLLFIVSMLIIVWVQI